MGVTFKPRLLYPLANSVELLVDSILYLHVFDNRKPLVPV